MKVFGIFPVTKKKGAEVDERTFESRERPDTGRGDGLERGNSPHVAMPHARPEQGALKTQIAVTLFRKEITFTREDATAKLFITLSAADSDSHLQVLVKISELLQDEEKAAQILDAADAKELYGYFKD